MGIKRALRYFLATKMSGKSGNNSIAVYHFTIYQALSHILPEILNSAKNGKLMFQGKLETESDLILSKLPKTVNKKAT